MVFIPSNLLSSTYDALQNGSPIITSPIPSSRQLCDGLYCTCQQCGVVLTNGICLNCIHGDGKPITCWECESPLRSGFCLVCDSKAENSFTYDPDSFNDTSSNFNYLPQPQLCGNNSHYGYDCPPQESLDNSSKEIAVSNSNQEKEEPSQDSDIHQLIEECSTEICEEQRQSMEDTMLELVKICQEKEFLCIHDNVEDLIESGLNSKLLLINSNSQRRKKEQQEVKNVVEQSAECGNRKDESKCDVPAKDDCSPTFTTFSNPLFNNDDLDSSNDESLPEEDVRADEFKVYSNPLFDEDEINSDKLDPHCFNVESDIVESLLNHDTFIDSSSKFDFSSRKRVSLYT
nr:hypothetical protein [Tanacetum cinerariifolium]